MRWVVATSTWNSGDLIGGFLGHYQRLGAEAVLVADYGSDDETVDVLQSERWRGFVELIGISDLARADPSSDLIALARTRFGDGWCLFCDPDELLVSSSMRIADLAVSGADVLTIPRSNMTGPCAAAATLDSLESMVYRLCDRVTRSDSRQPGEFRTRNLVPPWIFTAMPGKIAIRVDSEAKPGEGDHVAVGAHSVAGLVDPTAMLLHYPMRTYQRFLEKVRLAARDLTANDTRPPDFAWHWKRWISIANEGLLRAEYFEQFVPDRLRPRYLADGLISFDDRLARHWSDSPDRTLEWVDAG